MERLDKLRELERKLKNMLDFADERAIPAIAKQYRETLREIDELEGHDNGSDVIAELIARRADG